MNRRALFPSLVLLLVLAPHAASAGDGEEAFRQDEFADRSWLYDEGYFTRLLTFDVDKEWLDRWQAAANGLLATVGSVSSSEFYLREEVKLSAEFVPGSRLILRHVRDEDFDSRYQSFFAEWMQAVPGSPFSLSLLGQVSAEKEEDDIGFAATWRGATGAWARISWILADFTWNRKAPRGEDYTEEPRTLRVVTGFDLFPGLALRLDVGRTFPTAFVSAARGLSYRYEKTFAESLLTWRLRAQDQVWLAVEGEHVEKSRAGLSAGDIRAGSTTRDAFQARLEYLRHTDGGGRWIAGGRVLRLDEAADYPADPDRPPSYDFTEYALYGGYRTAAWRALSLEPRLYLTLVDDARLWPGEAQRSSDRNAFHVALALALGWAPRPGAELVLNPTFRLDEKLFGGGNLQLLLTF